MKDLNAEFQGTMHIEFEGVLAFGSDANVRKAFEARCTSTSCAS